MVKWSKFHTEDSKISGVTVQNLVTQATWCPECVHPWLLEILQIYFHFAYEEHEFYMTFHYFTFLINNHSETKQFILRPFSPLCSQFLTIHSKRLSLIRPCQPQTSYQLSGKIFNILEMLYFWYETLNSPRNAL
jgi:hypothetical protein